jgi:hypothetical protein
MAYDRRAAETEPSRPPDTTFDYRRELGRVFVPPNVARDFVILDAERAATLRAWTAALIPPRDARPAADEIGAAEYIDATLFLAPRLRAPLLSALDALDREAHHHAQTTFSACNAETQSNLLRQLEASRHRDVFAMIRELTYEAYYTHPHVLDALAAETGWQYETAFSGAAMEPFDERLLERMRTITPRYRQVKSE